MANSHGCCLTGGKFHQRCVGKNIPLSECKQKCDEDDTCKGYFERNGGSCQIATISACPSGWSMYNRGNVGEIDSHGTCGNGYGACFVKSA